MAQTLAEKSIALAEEKAALVGQLAEVSAKLAAMEQLLAESKAAHEQSAAAASAAEAKIADLTAQIEVAGKENSAMQEQIAELSNALALAPQAAQSNGTAPVKETPAQEAGDVATWQQALSACGGRYPEARTKYPKLFDAYMAEAAPKHVKK